MTTYNKIYYMNAMQSKFLATKGPHMSLSAVFNKVRTQREKESRKSKQEICKL